MTALTKPAGCFLQAVSLPIIIFGGALALSGLDGGCGKALLGGIVFAVGLACLYFGGRPARAKPAP